MQFYEKVKQNERGLDNKYLFHFKFFEILKDI